MTYASSQAHLLDELDRIGTLLDAYEGVDDEKVSSGESPADSPDCTHQQLPIAVSAADREDAETHANRIAQRCEATDEVTLRLHTIAETFNLSRRELDVLMLALAPRLDAGYHSVFQRVQNQASLSKPTILLVTELFSQTPAEQLAAKTLLSNDSPLRRHELVELRPPPNKHLGEQFRVLSVDDRLLAFLCGADGVDPTLESDLHQHGREDAFQLRDAGTSLDDLTIDAALQDTLAPLANATAQPRRFYFHGSAGTEKHGAVAAVCTGERYLQADLRAVLDAGALDRLYREAALLDCPLHLTSATAALEANPQVTLGTVFDRFADLDSDVIVTGTEPWTPTETLATDIDAIIEFPYPSIALRQQFWERHAEELPAEIDPEQLAGTFRLTQGELQAALSTARSLAGGDELTANHIYEGCTAQSAEQLDDLAQHIEPASTWEDIQLPADTMQTLNIVQSHITHQARIYSQWGFEDEFTRGTGVVALFSGPSGTGKTMAAEILANDVGMDLYRIDLSSVVSKYIGETEENLEEIFEAAENSNAILLFDEADAVFGDRADVSDATDRYANAEVNYLLQRIEAYDGVVLLTTNYEANIDSAFSRRIDHTVSFSRPEEETRDAIWQGIFPRDAPLGEIDYDFLAGFEFTGGQIKTIGQTAAILAAGDDTRIEMAHVVEAMQRQADKDGKMLDPTEFGQYRQFLSTTTDSTTPDTTETGRAEAPDPSTTEAVETPDSSPGGLAVTDSADRARADSTATSTDSTGSQDADNGGQSPEDIVQAFVDALATGDRETVHDLYHTHAIIEEFSHKQLRKLRAGDLTLVSEFERVQDDPDRVVIEFTQALNGEQERVAYELRPDDGVWQVFSYDQVTDAVGRSR